MEHPNANPRNRPRFVVIAASLALALGAVLGVTSPASAATTTVTGLVACINAPVVGVWVQASSSTSGWASTSMVTSGPNGLLGVTSARYTFTLNRGGNYQLNIGCGGSSAKWAMSVSTSTVSGNHNFVCNNLSWIAIVAGKVGLSRVFGFSPDLTQGVPVGKCKTVS